MRLILAVVVGFCTSVAADPGVCQNTGTVSCSVNKAQCCNVVPPPFVLGCAATCCEVLANEAGPGECPDKSKFFNAVDCECAAEETDGPTAEPTPGPTPLTPALTPCRSCTTKTDCDESEICDGPSARRGLRFGIQQEGCCRGAR